MCNDETRPAVIAEPASGLLIARGYEGLRPVTKVLETRSTRVAPVSRETRAGRHPRLDPSIEQNPGMRSAASTAVAAAPIIFSGELTEISSSG